MQNQYRNTLVILIIVLLMGATGTTLAQDHESTCSAETTREVLSSALEMDDETLVTAYTELAQQFARCAYTNVDGSITWTGDGGEQVYLDYVLDLRQGVNYIVEWAYESPGGYERFVLRGHSLVNGEEIDLVNSSDVEGSRVFKLESWDTEGEYFFENIIMIGEWTVTITPLGG